MHMADALLSPAVGATMLAASGVTLAYCARHVRERADDRLVPLMGVLGAFVFAAQMINFAIPATGSSGHLGGGLLLSILLGPQAAFLVIASVLTVQALFFADGGLLALGANIFNLGVLPCFVAYPLIYRALVGASASPRRITVASIVAAVVGLQLGAVGVVLQTVASGISSLPFSTFLLLMLPIHLAIGLVEGLATAAVVLFVRRSRPDLLEPFPGASAGASLKPLFAGFAVAAIVTGGALSWFASSQPDGLEWSIERAAASVELEAPDSGVHAWLAGLQQRTSWLPEYDLPATAGTARANGALAIGEAVWPDVKAGTSIAGIVGGLLTLMLVGLFGLLLKFGRR
jgi:cobalt/nickel transport system permease protein